MAAPGTGARSYPGLVDYGRTTGRSTPTARGTGPWWTVPDGRGRFYAGGFGFQRVACVPSTDLVVVRLGQTAEADYATPRAWFDELIAAFDT
ncbi:MAG: hypothetical protein R2695_15225 [Acidimicrobiales bacterium]